VNSLLSVGLILLLGFVGARLLKYLRLPNVTAFLIVGILIGPHLLDLITPEIMAASNFLSNSILGLIAFSLGESFRLQELRRGMKQVVLVSIIAAISTWILVTTSLAIYFIAIKIPMYPAIILGAVASATAPAATVLVIREYRASGPVTELLLKVVAIDDAWCLIFSAIAIACANAMSAHLFHPGIVFHSIFEIFGAILIGGLFGYGFSSLKRFVQTKEEMLVYTLGFILLNVGTSILFGFSVLLSAMVMGILVINLARENYKFFETLREVDAPLYLMFFIMSGANFDLSIVSKLGVVGVLYILFRFIGKVFGAKLGAHLSNAPKVVGKWIGWGLTPQAGVALGIGLIAKAEYPQFGNYIFTIIAATTVLFELFGPLLTKYSLKKAGEIAASK